MNVRGRAYKTVEPRYSQRMEGEKLTVVIEHWYAGLNQDEKAVVDDMCMELIEALRKMNKGARLGIIGARQLLARLYFHVNEIKNPV